MTITAEFGAKWLQEFRKIIGDQDEAAIAALHADLITIGSRYRKVIENTPCDLPGAPFNKSLTQRIAWLETKVISPAEKLRAALAEDQRAMFATWPYEHEFPDFPDRTRMDGDLTQILEFSTRLLRNLKSEQAQDAGTNQELRASIFYDISETTKRHLPSLKPSRGTYIRETNNYAGKYPDAMRHIYREITGWDDKLVRLIEEFRDS